MDAIKALGRELREAAGSRRKLQDRIGCSESTAQSWEKAGRVPDGVYLARIIRTYPEIGARLIAAIAPAPEDAAASEPLAAEDDPMTDPWPPELPHADQQATEDLPPPERRHGGDRRRGAG